MLKSGIRLVRLDRCFGDMYRFCTQIKQKLMYTELTDRALLCLSGKDSKKYCH
jgi:hypothetical protein